jgi:hypothetical protein
MFPRPLGLTALLGGLALSSAARAGPNDVLLLPVSQPELEAPVDLGPVSLQLRVVLGEAARDFGLEPEDASPATRLAEAELAGWKPDSWVLAPSLGWWGGALAVRLVIRAPGSRVLAVREERVTPSTLEVTTLGMLRELLAVARHEAAAVSALAPGPSEVVEPEPEAEYRSEGRAVLAFHTAALGAYLGFSLQRASGSNDARLTYPLAALGAGVGLGASVVVSEEWDIGVEHA